MITEEQYKEALTTINEYRKQLSLSVVSGSSKIDVYEWLKTEMMATTDITLKEFNECLDIWCNRKLKELQIAEFDKHYR